MVPVVSMVTDTITGRASPSSVMARFAPITADFA